MAAKKSKKKAPVGRKEGHIADRDPDRVYFVMGNGDVYSKPRGKGKKSSGKGKKFKGSGPPGHRVLTCKRGCRKK